MKAKRHATRLTRRSFRRKLVMFGVSVFASLAITATGFAAWVLSTDAMAETEGGIEVGSVSDAGVEIKDLVFKDMDGDAPISNFKFEPAADDKDGRVRVDENGTSEDMDIRISWTVKNYHNVASSFIEFKIPATVQAAIDKGYLAMPTEFEKKLTEDTAKNHVTEEIDGVTYYVYVCDASEIVKNNDIQNKALKFTVNKKDGITNVDFVLTLRFEWGTAFGGQNPSIYFDAKGAGAEVEYETVKETLLDLKACTFGITDANKAAALAKITNTEIKNSVKDKGIIEILGAMTVEEQDAFYADIAKPIYKVVVHATVN